jgi:ParB-like chromosome segregation protein Spo0J
MTGDAAFVRRFNQVELLPPTDQYVIEIYKHYIRSEAFKALNENYSITDNELGQMLGRLKRVPSNISLIDQGKKELDRLAMNAPVNLS